MIRGMAVSDIPAEKILNARTSNAEYLWYIPQRDRYRWDADVTYCYAAKMVPVDGQGLPPAPPAPSPLPSFTSQQYAELSRLIKPVAKVLTVSPDGTKQFTSPALANASIVDTSTPTIIQVYPGIYNDVADWIPKDNVTVSGTDRKRCILEYVGPVDATDAQLTSHSTIWLHNDVTLENLTITVENAQYAVHDEFANQNKNATHHLRNLLLVHKGVDKLNAWRAANGVSLFTSAATVYGWGSGSGVQSFFEDVTFRSVYQNFYYHNNKSFSDPTRAKLTRCRFETTSLTSDGIVLHSLGSGTADSLTLEDSELNFGFMTETDAVWTGDSKANHSEFDVVLANCTPIGYLNQTRGQALRVTYYYDDGDPKSTVSGISGGAAERLFGVLHYRNIYMKVAGRLNGKHGFAFGTHDVSGIQYQTPGVYGRTLGQRLGDQRVSKEEMLLVSESGYAVQKAFTKDYRSMTNAQVIDELNNMGFAGFGFDLYNPSKEESYPHSIGHEVVLPNTGVKFIPRWSPVVFNTPSRRSIRLMTPDDPASLFIGVSLETIDAVRPGRILRRGYLNSEQLADFYTQMQEGTLVYFADDATRGFAPTGTRLAMTGGANGFAYFDTTTR